MGSCMNTHSVRGFALEDKVYTAEDAEIIQRETFQKSVILQGQALSLEGEVEVAPRRKYVTFHEDVIAKKRLKRATIRVGVQSKATTGKGMNGCGFYPGKAEAQDEDGMLVVQEAFINQDFCVKELLPTYKQAAMTRQRVNGWESAFLSLEFEYAALKAAYNAWDTHAFMGDYGTADVNRTHTDGFIKDIVLAMGSVSNAIGWWTFSGDLTDLCIEYIVGGYRGSVPFNTDLATTLDDVVTEFTVTRAAIFVDANMNSLFTDVTATSTKIVIETAEQRDINVRFVITNCDGFTICTDGTLQAVTAITGAAVVYVLHQKAVTGQQPLSFDYEPITALNVSDKFNSMYAEIASKRPDLLYNPDFVVFVSPDVRAKMEIANSDAKKVVIGVCNTGMEKCETIWNGTPLIALGGQGKPMLPPNFIMGAPNTSLHAGTYLGKDVNDIITEYDRMCEVWKWKSEWRMGFTTTRRDNIIGTFTDITGTSFLTTFGAAQPDPFA